MRRSLPAVVLLAVAVTGLAGCGKKGPPLPPVRERPRPVSDLRSRQVGDRLLLSFARPQSRTTGAPLDPGATIEIGLTAESYGAARTEGETVWSLRPSEWDRYGRDGGMEVGLRLSTLAAAIGLTEAGASLSGRQIGFVVQVVEPDNRRGEPVFLPSVRLCEPAQPPTSGEASILEEGIHVAWVGPRIEAGTAPPRVNLYRFGRDERAPEAPTASFPLPEDGAVTWLDDQAAYGVAFRYVARLQSAPGCESADSPMLEAVRIDTFPPAAPQGLVAVAEGGAIRLFWRPNREPDLSGYRVWRAAAPGVTMDLLTPEDLLTTSYTDATVAPGMAYIYAVTARDRTEPPNESAWSERATETAERNP